ncbi:bifunctional 4-hydroxy-2-oxoglutarate aldolase/2-dehydro-3-deoxy-phosphogluconate aldolase [Paludifilum halophilum]|uniref:2-dehydro-3-deoxyphosphogluconate aldolase n=1 Tax=Paludifilum halophilum TaxID=1642702 RepID=A0A235B390_9BACL|nr:bifunctional 4-hydroxy-2-oxoglutarate aldolase/2-dehydro-3-deoxy-phosphogluconate aldolase [Paludifilum halophilum]OYD06702.1 hypothetical protein CHM34_14060 [Paludifilum halophilum]
MNESLEHRFIETIRKEKIIAIIRGLSCETIGERIPDLYKGGIRILEVTLNTPDADGIIRKLIREYDETLWIGAGTVLDMEDAEKARQAGARFFVSPHLDEEVIHYGRKHDIPVIPGAFTPTEILRADQAGASLVKVFPSRTLGPSYIKDLQGPLPGIPLMATGGVNEANAREYLQAGATAVGIGSGLFPKGGSESENRDQIHKTLGQLMNAVHS